MSRVVARKWVRKRIRQRKRVFRKVRVEQPNRSGEKRKFLFPKALPRTKQHSLNHDRKESCRPRKRELNKTATIETGGIPPKYHKEVEGF